MSPSIRTMMTKLDLKSLFTPLIEEPEKAMWMVGGEEEKNDV